MTVTIPLLSLRNVSRSFGTFKAVTDVSEDFGPEELNCIIGPNGAGKSTLLNMICGTLAVSSGSIHFGDESIGGMSGDKIARLGIARKFQVPSVFPSLSVVENFHVSASNALSANELDEILSTVNLSVDRDTTASELPHGKKQWLEIGMALSMQPKVLLLDEPTAGLSVDETRATSEFLRTLRGKVTVVVIEHDMAFVRDLKAHTMVLHHGKVIASGSFEDIENNDLVRDVYLGRR
ncbi:ATP-binding cassette domain-containing protein [Hoeflea poritis]|uniref:ATP-binding cassette domain-containing protein n=1 Tax=Hoeflea poritis TaxID=2993659 RepID=A0ABT4VVF5_9HYPH|nr:ATP-binding cassette domain-containing protein [Hoeflea poritis]MDA4848690.1 ATP-binding cassette domain-containing protein [Hoeflea poritis]